MSNHEFKHYPNQENPHETLLEEISIVELLAIQELPEDTFTPLKIAGILREVDFS